MKPEKAIRNGLLLDTNVLLVFVVAEVFGPARVAQFKRTSTYTVRDALILRAIVEQAPRLITTLQTLSELSNLLFKSLDPRGASAADCKNLIQATHEIVVVKNDWLHIPDAFRIGVADIVIAEAARRTKGLLVTVDSQLYQYALRNSIATQNFMHFKINEHDA
ncbi:MAG: hypothetical protein JNG88_12985 [Phycisphaerales bacterium]|nr:hypothetical protein [Phycisphaerales bacterium]